MAVVKAQGGTAVSSSNPKTCTHKRLLLRRNRPFLGTAFVLFPVPFTNSPYYHCFYIVVASITSPRQVPPGRSISMLSPPTAHLDSACCQNQVKELLALCLSLQSLLLVSGVCYLLSSCRRLLLHAVNLCHMPKFCSQLCLTESLL